MSYIKKADQLRILILEDSPERISFFKQKFNKHDAYFFDMADDAIEALRIINDKPWDIILLDHDLGGKVFVSSAEHNTGYTVAKYIADNRNDFEINQIIIHSLNPAAAQNMKNVLPEAQYVPYTLLRTKL